MNIPAFNIKCDDKARPFCSTRIIVDETNEAAKRLGLYNKEDYTVMYDTLCQSHGINPFAYWCAYELTFPKFLLSSAWPRPIIGLSKENIAFAAYGGYPTSLLNYSTLGVNRKHWPLITKKKMKDKFVFVSMCESNTRSGFDILIPAFCEQFRGNPNIILYIKDREATDTFKKYVSEQSQNASVTIIHDDRHLESFSEQVEIFESADAAICLNRSHTFGMVLMQGMSCGLPTLCQRYSGFTDYTSHLFNLSIDFDVVPVVQNDIDGLIKIGMKNHLFPINETNYPSIPFWSCPRKEDVKIKMQMIVDDKKLRETLSNMSDLTASWFTWDRTALNMSYILQDFKNKM